MASYFCRLQRFIFRGKQKVGGLGSSPFATTKSKPVAGLSATTTGKPGVVSGSPSGSSLLSAEKSKPSGSAPAVSSSSATDWKQTGLKLHNVFRAKHGLPGLTLDDTVST